MRGTTETETHPGPDHPWRDVGPGGASFERRLARLDAWDAAWTRPDHRYLKASALGTAASVVFWLLVALVPLALNQFFDWSLSWWLVLILPIIVLAWGIPDLLLVPRRARARGYAEREDDLLVRRGVFFHRVTVVPYGRMQLVQVDSGPIQRAFGLAEIELHTASAGTDAKILGVNQQEANRLREVLAERGRDRRMGL